MLRLAEKAVDYVTERSNKALETACTTSKYYGARTKQSAKEFLETLGYNDQKASEYYMAIQDKIRRGKAKYVYPYLNPKVVATTVDEISRKILLVHQPQSDIFIKSIIQPVAYATIDKSRKMSKRKVDPKEIKIVYMYRLDIMKLLEIVAVDKIQKEQENTIKRWNKRVKENRDYMDRVSKIISQTVDDEIKEKEASESTKECATVENSYDGGGTTATREDENAETNHSYLHCTSCCSCCKSKEEKDENHCCHQQNMRLRKKYCHNSHKTVSRGTKSSRQQHNTRKVPYSELRRNIASKLLEDLEKEFDDRPDELGDATQSEDAESLNFSQCNAGRSDMKPQDVGALLIQVPQNVNKIVLEKNGQRITLEI